MATNPIVANAARQLAAFRNSVSGTQVTFRGATYIARTEEVSGSKAGQSGAAVVPAYLIGNTDARLFAFDPAYFTPQSSEPLPEVGEYITYAGWSYQITHTTSVTAGGDTTLSVVCYGLKKIYPG